MEVKLLNIDHKELCKQYYVTHRTKILEKRAAIYGCKICNKAFRRDSLSKHIQGKKHKLLEVKYNIKKAKRDARKATKRNTIKDEDGNIFIVP